MHPFKLLFTTPPVLYILYALVVVNEGPSTGIVLQFKSTHKFPYNPHFPSLDLMIHAFFLSYRFTF